MPSTDIAVDFSVTFWIDLNENPSWAKSDSEINFPPFTVKNGIMVFFSKQKDQLKVFILHPDYGSKKITGDIAKYLNKSAFVALTNSSTETNLYINAELITTIEKSQARINIEVGDYVMVELRDGDIDTLSISGAELLTPAYVNKVDDENITLKLFALGPKTIVKKFSLDRIMA